MTGLTHPAIVSHLVETPSHSKIPLTPDRQLSMLCSSGIRVDLVIGDIIVARPDDSRGTVVVEVECPNGPWPSLKLALKIALATTESISEVDVVSKMRLTATSSGDLWALNHLPNIVVCNELDVSDALPPALRRFYPDLRMSETRQLRLILMERLLPLSSLSQSRDYGQAFFDILQIHHWVYDKVQILHHDISHANIMVRLDVSSGQIYGVLNDFDLAIYRDMAETKYIVGNFGTRPFMAWEMHPASHKTLPQTYLYRHELESIYYTILITVCRYHLRSRPARGRHGFLELRTGTPLDKWDSLDDSVLRGRKWSWILPKSEPVPMIPGRGFEMFKKWLEWLHARVMAGYMNRNMASVAIMQERPMADYDIPSMGGQLTYEHFFETMSSLDGQALIVRGPGLEVATMG